MPEEAKSSNVVKRAAAISAVLGAVAAAMVLIVRYNEIRKSYAEAEKAVAESDAARRPQGGPGDAPRRDPGDGAGPAGRPHGLNGTKWRVRHHAPDGGRPRVETVEFIGDRYLVHGRGDGPARAHRYQFTDDGRLRSDDGAVELVSVGGDELVLSWGGEVTRYGRTGETSLWVWLAVVAASALALFFALRYLIKYHEEAVGCAGCASVVAAVAVLYFFGRRIWWWLTE